MPVYYFAKELCSHPIRMPDGNAIQWELVGNDKGVRVLNDVDHADILAVLNEKADKRAGGVRRISAEIYESLKKNKPLTPSPLPSGLPKPLRVYDPEAVLPKPSVPVPASPPVAASPRPVPLAMPRPEPQPQPATTLAAPKPYTSVAPQAPVKSRKGKKSAVESSIAPISPT